MVCWLVSWRFLASLSAFCLYLICAAPAYAINYWDSWPPSYQPSTASASCQSIADHLGNGDVHGLVPEGEFAMRCYYHHFLVVGGIRSDVIYPHCDAGYIRTNKVDSGCVLDYPRDKDGGAPCGDKSVGNPCNIASGNKYEEFVDYETGGPNPLRFVRYYNSGANRYAFYQAVGTGWSTSFSMRLEFDNATTPTKIRAIRPDGRAILFTKSGSQFLPDSDVGVKLTGASPNWTLTDTDDTVETYLNTRIQTITQRNGYSITVTMSSSSPYSILSVQDSYGRQLTFQYTTDSIGRRYMTQMTAPGSQVFAYDYDYSNARPSTVLYPDSSPTAPTFTYHYEDTNNPWLLTGITDEKSIRFATWSYDSVNRMTSSQHAGGAELTTITYDDVNKTRTVTNSLGQQFKYYTTLNKGSRKLTKIERLASASVPFAQKTFTYDSNGYLSDETDWNGNSTTYVHDSRGLETSRTEADGTTEARTIATSWLTSYRLPSQIVEPGKTTSFTYSSGLLTQKSETDTTSHSVPYVTNGQTRTWSYSYTSGAGGIPANLLETIDGPRTDVSDITTFTYDTSGRLIELTNALGHEIQITSYNDRTLPLTTIDDNGVTTTLTYDAVGRLTSSSVATGAGAATTTIEYDLVGQVAKVIQPDGAFLEYIYDDARRLTEIVNNLGETIEYTIDAMGNRTRTDIKDAGSTILNTHQQTFDTLGRLLSRVGAASQTTTLAYDHNGNVVSTTDPLTRLTTQTFDALNRAVLMTDPASGTVGTVHDNRDNLTDVTDPRGLVTSYVHNGFGDVIQLTSPDTGTAVYEYDLAGNLTRQTDAAGTVVEFAYDALNRQTTKSFPAASAENVAYVYDQVGGVFGVGRLTSLTDQSGSTDYEYDEQGNITKHIKTIGANTYTTLYAYNLARRLTQMTYPSGRTVDYTRDAMGRVTAVDTANGGSPTSVLSNVTYLSFGGVTSWDAGNGLTLTRTYDSDYQLTGIATAPTSGPAVQDVTLGYDVAGNITSITDNRISGRTQAFVYDTLDRLTQAAGAYGTLDYSYDSVGNRLTRALTGSTSFSETYAYSGTSNRLLTVNDGSVTRTLSYGLTGHITDDDPGGAPARTLSYNANQRLIEVSASATPLTNYLYDSFEQRVQQSVPSAGTVQYLFDIHGRLQAEMDGAGTPLREYLYLDGERKAMALWVPSALYFFHRDHLGTPQAITDISGTIVWEGVYRPFGEVDETVTTLANSQRLPGQHADAITGYFQNWHRDYDARLGRYLQSDPIGLIGGTNTYMYAEGNPIRFTDPMGLFNPAKGASALGNVVIAGVSAASGITKIVAAAGLSPAATTGVGALPPVALAGWGAWNLKSAKAAWERGLKQWEEAQCEGWHDATWKNFWGLAPGGTEYDDPNEFSGPLDYIRSRGLWQFVSEMGYF